MSFGRSSVYTFIGKDEFSKVAGQVEKSAGGMSAKMGKFGKTMGMGLAVGGAAAAAGLVAVGAAGFKMAKGAEAARVADRKLAQVFKSMGYEQHAAAAAKYADQLERTTGIEAESIKAAQTKLATFTDVAKSQDLMTRATKMAADMSAAGFGDMGGAAVGLGKALQDPIAGMSLLSKAGSLTKDEQKAIGDEFKRTGDKAAAQESILKALEKQVGGVAEASATSGDKIKASFGQVGDAIGAKLLPVFDRITPKIQDLADWVAEAITNMGDFGDSMDGFGEKLKPVIDTMLPAFQDALQWIKDEGPGIGDGLLTMAAWSVKAFRGLAVVGFGAAEAFIWLGASLSTGEDRVRRFAQLDDFRQWKDRTVADMETVSGALQDGADWLDTYGQHAKTVEAAKLRADITDLEAKLATAWTKLKDPELSSTKEAKLRANHQDLLEKVYEAKKRLGEIDDKNVRVNVDVHFTKSGQDFVRLPTGKVVPLASGGIVTRPTLALIGEAGPEAVIPLSKGGATSAGGDTYNIIVQGGLDSAETIARTVQTALLDLKRRQGVSLGLG